MAENPVRQVNIAAPGNPEDIRWVFVKDGVPCPFALVDTPRAKRVNGLLLIRKDLDFSEIALTSLIVQPKTDETLIIRQSLWFAAVVSYAKCFVGAEGRGTKLERDDVFRGDVERLREIHEWIMRLRHTYIVHAGNNEEEEIKTWIAMTPDSQPKALVGHYHNMDLSLSIFDGAAVDYLRVIQHIKRHIEALLDKAYASLKEETAKRPLEEWYAVAVTPHVPVIPEA